MASDAIDEGIEEPAEMPVESGIAVFRVEGKLEVAFATVPLASPVVVLKSEVDEVSEAAVLFAVAVALLVMLVLRIGDKQLL